MSRYGTDATRIQFPYPMLYSDAVVRDETLHFLLMTLRPAAFRHCHPDLMKRPPGAAVR